MSENLQVFFVGEDPVTGGVGGFFQDAQLLKLFDGGGSGVVADAKIRCGTLDVNNGMLLQIVKYSPNIILGPFL